MNKKAVGMIGFVFFLIAFVFLWIVFLAPYLATISDVLLADGQTTGLLAFVYANFNLFILIGLVLLILIGMYVPQ
jgi:TRAP-type mannitol/chloroaromatic compound transport system permease small subunit